MLATRSGSGAGHSRTRGAMEHSGQVGVARRAVDHLAAPDVISRQGGKSFVVGQGIVRIGVLVARRRACQEPHNAPGQEMAGGPRVTGGKTQRSGIEVSSLVHKGAQDAPRPFQRRRASLKQEGACGE